MMLFMMLNYFKIAWRNLRKGKIYSIINISGLAIGMALAVLIGLWIWDELSFNRYFDKHSTLAQVMVTQVSEGEWNTGKTTAVPVAGALRTSFPNLIKRGSLVTGAGEYSLQQADKRVTGTGRYVQEDFAAMFTLKMVEGHRDALIDPSSIFISRSLAETLFGDQSPLYKQIKVSNKHYFKIAGIYEDFPFNTSFYNTRILLPWSNSENWQRNVTEWSNHSCELFVEITGGFSFEEITARVKNVPTPHITGWQEELLLHPVSKLNLYTQFVNGQAAGGRIEYVWLFGIIGIFVLLLACINFMNLSTARSEKRSKEVGIRKAMGSLRRQLIEQFLCESILIAVLASVICIALVQLILPWFNQFSGKQTAIPFDSTIFWVGMFSFTFLTGLIAGSYPAFYLSGFKAIRVLKGAVSVGRFAGLPRKALVVLQYTVSITLIIGTIIVYKQVQHARNRSVGYNQQGLLVSYATPEQQKNFESLRHEIIQSGAAVEMCAASYSPLHFSSNNSVDWKGKNMGKPVFFRNVNVSPEFGKTIGWTISRGRDFSREHGVDSLATILSKSAARIIGFKDPIGEVIGFDEKNYTIIGVVEDMVTQSPFDPGEPTIYFTDGWKGVFTIRLQPGMKMLTAIENIKSVFKKFTPEDPYYYSFLDEEYGKKFIAEQRISSLATFFAVLAIFISCLGLFGLASFIAEKRTKEVGVRKVMGASVTNVWRLLSGDFLKLTIISILIAIPVAYQFMERWLENYSYRTNISWWVFGITAIGTILITLVTVSFQTIKAARSNPIKALRTE